MIKFFKQIYKKILKFDDYTNQYVKISNNIEIPSLAYTNWGIHFANLKDFKSAVDKLETAMMMSNSDTRPCISLGLIYAKNNEYEKAEKVLNEALKRDSQNSHAYSVLGSIYIAENKFVYAEEALKKAQKLAPSDAEIYMNYGVLYAKMQKKHKAIEMLKKSKFLNPSNAHTYFLLGVLFFETNKITEAFIQFKQLEKISPDYKNLNYYFSLCYKKEKNYPAVIEYAQKALKEDAGNALIYILIAQTYIYLNKNDKVFEIYKQGETHGIRDFEFYLTWGIALLRINKIQEAKEKIYKAIEIKNNSSLALYRLGCCFYKENNLEEAENYFNKALESDSQNSSAMADLGIVYYDKKDYRNAMQIFFKAIDISIEKAYLYFYIANCYYRLGRLKKSVEFYEKTVEYYPRHIEALINCTVCLLELNNTKEALRKIRNAYQINRNSEKVILIYAITDLKAGIYSDAIEKTDMLLNENPDRDDIKIIKIHILINLNKPQEALNLWHSLKEEDKNSDLGIYLAFQSYKILVEENHSNYNENMYNFYLDKMNNIDPDSLNQNGISTYIDKALNINKG